VDAAAATEIVPVTPDRLTDLADLFESNGATRGCWCMAFLVPRSEYYAGRFGGNRVRFEELTRSDDPPMGLLALRDGVPVGWCSVGPRSRYTVATSPRSILKGRDPSEDDTVWLAPCFFVRVGHRRKGITTALLGRAVDAAAEAGATAIEGWPIADGYGRAESFEGREHVFVKHGFHCVSRPSPRRAIMRLELRGT
jgi:GNAT superfamily N-acetyltransferase